jgi:hypothetical protein
MRALIFVLLAACASAPSRPGPPAAPPADRFAAVEERLTHARMLRFDYHGLAEGAVTAEVWGQLSLVAGRVELTVHGHLTGARTDIALIGEGSAVTVQGKTRATPPRLREALVIGLTRHGLLNTITRAAAGLLPDHADGGVEEWAQVSNVKAVGSDRLSFVMMADGHPVGEAELQLDGRGLPLRRFVTVHFPAGDMHLTEDYEKLEIEP